MAQPPPTVRDVLRARIERLREKKRRLLDEAQGYQVEIDTLKAEMDALTVGDETKLARLQQLTVIEAKD